MVESIIVFSIIGLSLIVSLTYIIKGIIAIFRRDKDSSCSCCEQKKICKK